MPKTSAVLPPMNPNPKKPNFFIKHMGWCVAAVLAVVLIAKSSSPLVNPNCDGNRANHKSDSGTLEIQKFSPGGQLDGTVFQILRDGVIYQFQSSRDFYYVTGDPNQSKRFDGESPGLPVDRIGLYHYRDASGIQRTLPAYKFRK